MKVIIRANTAEMRDDRIEELCDWVRSLGVDPKNVRASFAIAEGENSYELHLAEYVRHEGKMVIDHARNDVVTKPLVVDLGQMERWPGWLNELRTP